MSNSINAGPSQAQAAPPMPGPTAAHDKWLKDTFKLDAAAFRVPGGGHPAASGGGPGKATEASKPKAGGGKLGAIKDFVNEHVKVEVKQVGKDDPPMFAISTTITFSGNLDKKGSKSFGDDKKGKLEVEGHVKIEAEVKETYTQLLSHEDAQQYVECIKNNGKGGKFPEQQVLVTALKAGWERAKEIHAGGAGVAEQGKTMQVGAKRHLEATAGAEAGVGVKGEKSGYGVGIEAQGNIKHKNILDIEKLPDGMLKVTAAVSDEHGASGALSGSYSGVKGKVGSGQQSSTMQNVVLVLDPNSSEYADQMKEITDAKTAKDLHKLAEHLKKLVKTRTTDTSDKDNDEAELGRGKDALTVKGKSEVTQSVTTDSEGKVVKSDTAGKMDVEYGVKHDKTKLELGKQTGHEGSVDEHDHAEGVLSEEGADAIKSLVNAAKAVAKGGLKALDKPEDFIAKDTRHTGKLEYADEELKAICARAQNASKWNAIVPGLPGALWAAVGRELRASTIMENYKVAKIDKTAVEKALSEWMASGTGDNMRAIETALRPDGAAGHGHAQAFPKGTEELEKVWKAVVTHDTLPGIKNNLAQKPGPAGIKDAATALKALHSQLAELRDGFKKDAKLWKDADGLRLAEMQGLVQSRISEVDAFTQELKKQTAAGATGTAAEDSAAKLKTYKDELESMRSYHSQIWKILKVIEAARFPGGNTEFIRDLKNIQPLFFQWDETYARAEKLAKELKHSVKVDEDELMNLYQADTVRAYNAAKQRVGVP